MKVNHLIIALLLAGCSSQNEQPFQMKNLEKDFPTVETLISEELGKYELYGYPKILVKDSLLFVLEKGTQENFGRCFNINTGKEINTLVKKGRANNEMVNIDEYMLLGDSLQAICGNHPQSLKLYSIKDIVEGNAYNPREIYMPDTLESFSFGLIDHKTIFGVSRNLPETNDTKYFIFDGHTQKEVGKLSKDLVKANIELTNSDLRFGGILFKKQNDKIIVASGAALQLERIDLNTLSIEKSRYYSKVEIEIEKDEHSIMTSSVGRYFVKDIGCNENNIYVVYKMREDKVNDFYILKFDWNFNPISKYKIDNNSQTVCFSDDCSYIYSLSENNDYSRLYRYKL